MLRGVGVARKICTAVAPSEHPIRLSTYKKYKMMTYLTLGPSWQSILPGLFTRRYQIKPCCHSRKVSNCHSSEGKTAIAWGNKNSNVLDKMNEARWSSKVCVQTTILENRLLWNYIQVANLAKTFFLNKCLRFDDIHSEWLQIPHSLFWSWF